MQSVDLKVVLDDKNVAKEVLPALGIIDVEAAHRSLVNIAKNGVTLDLLNDVLSELAGQLPLRPDPDLGLKNLERFIISSRSPISLAALLVRDPTALSALLDIFSSSQFLSDLLVNDPESFDLIRLTDGQPVAKETLDQELRSELKSTSSLRAEKNRLRRFWHREILRIAYGDIIRKFDVERTSQQLTYLAETICETAFDYCQETFEKKHGAPTEENGKQARVAVICHGRLGSGDMDYASPLLLSVIYDSDGQTNGKFKISNKDFFERMIEEFSELVSENNDLGNCYQIEFDRRVSRGSTKCSLVFDAIKFFDQNSTASDRLEWIQSRFLCGDKTLADQFISNLRSQVFRSYFNNTDLVEFQSLKRRLSTASGNPSQFRNVRTSAGGLSDLEFTVRFLQLLVGKKIEAVQNGNYFQVLFELENNKIITQQEYSVLKDNYVFLRHVFHRLQLYSTSASEVLPRSDDSIEGLSNLVRRQFGWDEDFSINEKIEKVAAENRAILKHLLQQPDEAAQFPERDLVLGGGMDRETVSEKLHELGFQNPLVAQKNMEDLATEKHRFISSKRCRYFLSSIITDLLDSISRTPDPDETLNVLAKVSDSLGGKGTLWELFQFNKSYLDLYVDLCSKTPYLATILQSNPGMLDELMDSLTLDRVNSVESFQQELNVACAASRDIQPIVLAFRNSKHLQIGVSQLLRDPSTEEIHKSLTAVADCCLQKIANNEFESLVEKHGCPSKNQFKDRCHFSLLFSGKMGGQEPNYHSKASFWIVYDKEGATTSSPNQESISNHHFFGLLASRMARSVSQIGPGGRVFELDPLPDELGGSITIALSAEGLTSIQQKRRSNVPFVTFLAQTRVTGDCCEFNQEITDSIENLISETAWDSNAWDLHWQSRLTLERDASRYNLKRGFGGTLDIEFATHFLYVANYQSGPRQTNTVSMLRQLVSQQKIDSSSGKLLITAYQLLRKMELFLRLMDLPDRHTLPWDEPSNEDELGDDQSRVPSPTKPNRASCFSPRNPVEVQQAQLATLMKYDRFISLLTDIESCQKDNRRLTLAWAKSNIV